MRILIALAALSFAFNSEAKPTTDPGPSRLQEVPDPNTGEKIAVEVYRGDKLESVYMPASQEVRQRAARYLTLAEARKSLVACVYVKNYYTPGYFDEKAKVWDLMLYSFEKVPVLAYLPNGLAKSVVLDGSRLRIVYFWRHALTKKLHETEAARNGSTKRIRSDLPMLCVPDKPASKA